MHAHVALVAGIVAPGRSRTDRDAAHLRDVELARQSERRARRTRRAQDRRGR